MILLAILMHAAGVPELNLSPFDDEQNAARGFEAHLFCLGNGAFDHKDDPRSSEEVSDEVILACQDRAEALRSQLVDVYIRKPEKLPHGSVADAAARDYLAVMHDRVRHVIRERASAKE